MLCIFSLRVEYLNAFYVFITYINLISLKLVSLVQAYVVKCWFPLCTISPFGFPINHCNRVACHFFCTLLLYLQIKKNPLIFKCYIKTISKKSTPDPASENKNQPGTITVPLATSNLNYDSIFFHSK